ncbi:cytochrome P450 [Nocardia spumae]|uniref:cytochrome P450 n=1 Tax=Nocardia spumae TaxID=2887190 RepID=UPI001D1548CC|nr:cytochrome P450 [Nocardia spumae]
MTTPHSLQPTSDRQLTSIYTDAFAADSHSAYREMRRRHPCFGDVELAPGVPATLVIGYETAVQILNDPEHFPADPRRWQGKIPPGSPILSVLGWRPNALRSEGAEHARYRTAISDAIGAIDLHAMHAVVEDIAIALINDFCTTGQGELIAQYIYPLVCAAINTMLGIENDIGEQVAAGMAATFGAGGDPEVGNKMLVTALQDHLCRTRAQPGDDVTSRLIAHAAGLTDDELVEQIATLYGAAVEPQVHLIANALLLMVTDERFSGSLHDGSLSTRDALDGVLFNNPPLANYCARYPRQPVLIEGVWLPADEPVLVSMAAANDDPKVRGGDRSGNRSHLAFGAGRHRCPAQSAAYRIAQDAVDQLLDAIPDAELEVPVSELRWRPGPFHRSLVGLPVVFPPSPPLNLVRR